MQENETPHMEESSGMDIEETEDGASAKSNGIEPLVKTEAGYTPVEQTESSDVSERGEEDGAWEQRPRRKVSLFSFIVSTVSLIVATLMITFTVCTTIYRRKLASVTKGDQVQNGIFNNPSTGFSEEDAYIFGLINQFFEF